ncbi:hypothetical protein, partial [Bradyrhizobium sp.]|uniref:hypothetical protein n=1 Tax=Bradyrhizobium sp. TaxID=376 RepID=UPI003C4345A9
MSGVARPEGRLSGITSSFVLSWGMVLLLAPAGFAQTTARPVITPTAKPAPAAPQLATPQAEVAMVDT